MEWVRVSDLVDGRGPDPGLVPRLLAYIEARSAYETLAKVLQLLYNARAAGLVEERLVDLVSDWLSEAESLYNCHAAQLDIFYLLIYDRAERLAERLSSNRREEMREVEAG